MDKETIELAYKKHKSLVDSYFKNNGQKLYILIDKVLFKLKYDVEKSDFYSLGNEIFLDVLCRYDEQQDFNGFLYSCLINKFKTEMTRRNRQKRKSDKDSISIDTHIGKDENSTLGDVIASNMNVEREIFGDDSEIIMDEKIERYLCSLSKVQRRIIEMKMQNIEVQHIKEELGLTDSQYSSHMNEVVQYEHIRLLHI